MEIHGKTQVQTVSVACSYNEVMQIYIIIVGFVFSVKPLFRTFVLGITIELQVNVSTDYSASHIETLTWYHNETEIPSSSRVSVLNSGRRILIRDATHSDAGNYKVEIASLDFRDPAVCDSVWLPLLRNHAAHAPVTFTLNELPSSSKTKAPQ